MLPADTVPCAIAWLPTLVPAYVSAPLRLSPLTRLPFVTLYASVGSASPYTFACPLVAATVIGRAVIVKFDGTYVIA